MELIDFHSHIIPRADHGSSSTDETIIQLKYATKYGVERIIATPHFYPHVENVEAFIKRRNACFDRLKARYSNEFPKIILGAEVLICDNIEEMPMLDEVCISGTNILLLELPFTDFSDSYIYSVKALINNGYTVVIAHADRYDPRNVNRLITAGAYVQLNADALSGLFIPKHIKKWLSDERVFALGSDIHGPDKKAYKKFSRAIRKLGEMIQPIKKYSDTVWYQRKK